MPAQSFLKLLFKKSRLDDQSSTNESLDNVTGKNMQQKSGEQKRNYVFFISFLALFTFSFMKYRDPFPFYLMKNKISGLKLLLQHTYYYVERIIFIEVPDVLVPIIDTLPSTQTNSAKEDGEMEEENYYPSEMFQDLKNQKTIIEKNNVQG